MPTYWKARSSPNATATWSSSGSDHVALCLTTSHDITGNDVAADGKSLIAITGANGCGKSTFLRSVGAAQL